MRFALVMSLLLVGCKRSPAPVVVDAGGPPMVVERQDPVRVAPAVRPAEASETVVELTVSDGGAPELTDFTVATEPSDASVSFNHRDVGHSPVVIRVPPQGAFLVSAEMPGYQPTELTVWPKADQPHTLLLRLYPELVDAGVVSGTVTLLVESFPTGAYVLIDGVDAGITPLNAVVSARPHELIVLYAAYVRSIQYVDAGPGESQRIFAKLVPAQ